MRVLVKGKFRARNSVDRMEKQSKPPKPKKTCRECARWKAKAESLQAEIGDMLGDRVEALTAAREESETLRFKLQQSQIELLIAQRDREVAREDLSKAEEAQKKLAYDREMWMKTAKNWENLECDLDAENRQLRDRIARQATNLTLSEADVLAKAYMLDALCRALDRTMSHLVGARACWNQAETKIIAERKKVSDLISGLQKMQGKWWFQGVKQDIADLLARYSDDGAEKIVALSCGTTTRFYDHSKVQK